MSTLKNLAAAALVILMTGCATYANLPIQTATVTDAEYSMRKSFKPSMTGAAVGAATGGVLGHQVGKGNGKKLATALGVAAGAVTGAAAGGTTEMVPISMITFRDDVTGQTYSGTVDGTWQTGMKVRYSLTDTGKIILR